MEKNKVYIVSGSADQTYRIGKKLDWEILIPDNSDMIFHYSKELNEEVKSGKFRSEDYIEVSEGEFLKI